MRHYLNLTFLWSVLTSFRTIGPFELNWETQQYKCWLAQVITFGLLAALQLLNLFWFGFIIRIAYRAIFNKISDERSEDEGTEPEEDSKKSKIKHLNSNGGVREEKYPPLAMEASGVEAVPSSNGSTRTTRPKGKSNVS